MCERIQRTAQIPIPPSVTTSIIWIIQNREKSALKLRLTNEIGCVNGSRSWKETRELKAAIDEHPILAIINRLGSFLATTIFGVPDPYLGQRVAGLVQLADGPQSVDLNEILTFATERLADYKVPETLEVVDKIPRNTLGKIDDNCH